MNRITERFLSLRKKNEVGLIPFITAGDPSEELTKSLLIELEEAGADIIELGVPFSDPIADGVVIQASCERALKRGISLSRVIDLVGEVRKEVTVPLVLLSYYNPIYRYGLERFILDIEGKIDGLVVPDLPPEEAKELIDRAGKIDLAVIFLVAPTSIEKRIESIIQYSTGFIYYVSVTGTTGMRDKLFPLLEEKLKTIKAKTDKPICVGFGISTVEQVRAISRVADGVIVGSAVVDYIFKHRNSDKLIEGLKGFISQLKLATKKT